MYRLQRVNDRYFYESIFLSLDSKNISWSNVEFERKIERFYPYYNQKYIKILFVVNSNIWYLC